MEFSRDSWCRTERLVMKLMVQGILEGHSAYFSESKMQFLTLLLFIFNILNCLLFLDPICIGSFSHIFLCLPQK